MDNPGNQNPAPRGLPVIDEVVLHRKNSKARLDFISGWSSFGGPSEKREPASNCVDKTVRSFNAGISRDVQPNSIEVRLCRPSEAVTSHRVPVFLLTWASR